MRYIKHFESKTSTERRLEKDLYSRISVVERDNNLRNKRQNFTKGDIEVIRDLVNETNLLFTIYPSTDGGYTWEYDLGSNIKQHIQIIKNSGGAYQKDTKIYKIEDEYFIIVKRSLNPNPKTISYICDQLDGLVKCLTETGFTF